MHMQVILTTSVRNIWREDIKEGWGLDRISAGEGAGEDRRSKGGYVVEMTEIHCIHERTCKRVKHRLKNPVRRLRTRYTSRKCVLFESHLAIMI